MSLVIVRMLWVLVRESNKSWKMKLCFRFTNSHKSRSSLFASLHVFSRSCLLYRTCFKSHLFKWSKMIIVMDAHPLPLQPLSCSPSQLLHSVLYISVAPGMPSRSLLSAASCNHTSCISVLWEMERIERSDEGKREGTGGWQTGKSDHIIGW